ncbi:MAG: helix-turn-helix transcriptional regulator [Candidatus Sumerlaeota bacterium]
MAKYGETNSELGSRIIRFREKNNLTQADLADRYKVSGPAIFKFEKGFLIPSLKLWLRIANDIGVPEKEAVLIWAREKLPDKMHDLISTEAVFEVDDVMQDLEKASSGKTAGTKARSVLQKDVNVSPALKSFASNTKVWNILKPTLDELRYLIQLDQVCDMDRDEDYRDALLLAREIESGK